MSAHRWPAIDHLLAMTDDVGLFQHATLDVPNRAFGYCTDDIARALIVACDAAERQGDDPSVSALVPTYLAFLNDARIPAGGFHGFMGYDRRWQDQIGTDDQVARALWGLGYAEGRAARETWRLLAGALRRHALEAVPRLTHIRSRAYAALGLAHALGARPDDELVVRTQLDALAATLAADVERHRSADWVWCEDVMTYDNARIPEALLRAGAALGSTRYCELGLAILHFYADAVIVDGRFEPVGNDGWYPRGGKRADFDQQPIEVAALADACMRAVTVTGDSSWLAAVEMCVAWFLGDNDAKIALLDEQTGGGCDGLKPAGRNGNQGAESTMAMISVLQQGRRLIAAPR